MGGGFGHISQMVKKNRENTIKRKERVKEYKKKGATYSKIKKLKFKEVSEEELERIKLKIHKKFRKRRITNRLILAFSIVVGLLGFVSLLRLTFN